MERKEDNVDILFLPIVPETIRAQLEQVKAALTDISPPNSIERPTFVSRPNTKATDFHFEAEIQCLPFRLILGEEMDMTHIQQILSMTILRSSPYMIRISDFVARSDIQH